MSEPRTKVVHLITLLEFGGAQGNTLYTVEHLDPKKYDVHLWAGKGAYWDDKLSPYFRKQPVRFFGSLVRSINPILDFIALLQLTRALKKLRPQILHTHSSKAGILGRLAGRWAHVPHIVHTFHGFGFNEQQKPWVRWGYIFLEKIVARFSERLIFVSRANIETASQLGIGDPKKFVLIRSGIPIKAIRELASAASKTDIRKKLNIRESAKVVTTIGAFKPQKNLNDFLKAASLIRHQIPEAFFILLGDGELRTSLEQEVRHLGLATSLLMPGWRQDATQILAASDVFVMTSLWEGLPRALVEAMALGIPSVCYDTDGVRDLIGDQKGSIIPQGKINQLVQSVVELLNNKEEHGKRSKTSLSKVGIEFDIDEMVHQQDRLYQELLVDNIRRKH